MNFKEKKTPNVKETMDAIILKNLPFINLYIMMFSNWTKEPYPISKY
jgi:hypothetical protein